MSSLVATGKHIDVLCAFIVECREKLASIKSQSSVTHDPRKALEILRLSLTKQTSELHAVLLRTVRKLVDKIDSRDPVSGTLRYGDVARAKILGFNEKLSELQSELVVLLSEVEAQLVIANNDLGSTNLNEVSKPEEVAKNVKGAPIVGPIASIDRFVDFKVIEKPHHSAASGALVDQGEHSTELEEKARLVRERKALEAEHAARVNLLLHNTLEETVLHFNSIRNLQLQRVAGKDSSNQLSGPFSMILQAHSSVAKDALKTVLGILERIISRPDDIAARRLRITHPVLKEKLTGVVGGIELLLALGFQARLQSPDPALVAETKQPSPAYMTALEATLQEIRSRDFADLNHVEANAEAVEPVPGPPVEVRYAVSVFPLLAPHTAYEVHLEMTEPSIDTLTSSATTEGKAVKLSWLDWFDSLNAYKGLVEEALKKCC